MPELPEVETVKRGLEAQLKGQVINNVLLRRADLRFPIPEQLPKLAQEAFIDGFQRYGKYLCVMLSTRIVIIIHLGMSGSIRFMLENEPFLKHDHVVFTMKNGLRWCLNDPRRFGFVDLILNSKTYPALEAMGPDPFHTSFNATYLRVTLGNRSRPIKTALLDQAVVAGLGNIYVCEALWQLGVSPLTKCCDIKDEAWEKLPHILRHILEAAIASGGSSLRDHKQVDGKMGYFQNSFKVYARQDKPCQKDGCHGTIKRIVQGGRASFFCSICQT